MIPFLPFTAIRAIGKGVGWASIGHKRRKVILSTAVLQEVRQREDIKQNFSTEEMLHISEALSEEFIYSDEVPDEFEVTKRATYYFASAIVKKELDKISVPCSEYDKEVLSKGILAELNACVEQSQSQQAYTACVQGAEQLASYRAGYAITQILGRDAFKDIMKDPNELDRVVKKSASIYEKCAQERIFKEVSEAQDKQIQVCVAYALSSTIREIAHNEVKSHLSQIASLSSNQVNDFTRKIFSEAKCKIPTIKKAENVSDGKLSTSEANRLEYYFINGDASAELKSDIFDCVNQISVEAGRITVAEVIKSTPQTSHLPVNDIIRETYLPCVDELIKKSNSQSTINPQLCEPRIRAAALDRIVGKALDEEIPLLTKDLSRQQQQEILLSTRKSFTTCIQNREQLGISEVGCLKNSLSHMIGNYGELRTKKDLPLLSGSQTAQIHSLAKACVEKATQKISQIENFESALPALKEECNRDLVSFIAPLIAENKIEGIFKEYNLDFKKFKEGPLQNVNTHLKAQKNPDTLDFERRVTWEAYNHIASTEVSKAVGDKNPELKGILTKHFSSQERQGFLEAPSSEALQEKLDSAQVSLYTDSTIAVVTRQLSESLHPKSKVTLLKPAEEKFKICMGRLKTTANVNPCISQYVIDGTQALVGDYVRQSIVNYPFPNTEPDPKLKAIEGAELAFKQCAQKITDSPRSSQFSEAIKKCAESASLLGGLNALQVALPRMEVRSLSSYAGPDSALESGLNHVLVTCFRFPSDSCQKDLELAKKSFELALRAGPPAQSPTARLLETELGRKIVVSRIAESFEKTLEKDLLPYKSIHDNTKRMELVIKLLGRPQNLVDRLSQTQNGKDLVDGIRKRITQDPNYDAGNDPKVSKDFKALLLADTEPGNFSERVLIALAEPEYYHALNNLGTIKFSAGVIFNKINDRSYSFDNALKTDSGKAAQQYIRNQILAPIFDEKGLDPKRVEEAKTTLAELLEKAAKEAAKKP